MRWRPHPDHAAAWSAVGGVVTVIGASSAVLFASQPSSAHIPPLVIYGFVALAALGIYGMLAPLLCLWPWRRTSSSDRSTPTDKPPSEGLHREAISADQATPAKVGVVPVRTDSLALLEELLTEGEAMLEDSNVFNAVTGRQSQYGPATPAKVEKWKRSVLAGLPEVYADQFRFPSPESVEEKMFRALKYGPEAKEVRRLRRHVDVLQRLMGEMWGNG